MCMSGNNRLPYARMLPSVSTEEPSTEMCKEEDDYIRSTMHARDDVIDSPLVTIGF